jgi:hypothetical protein
MKRAIFFVLLLALEPVLFSQNLVVNPGFETWTKINKPFGWTTAESCLKDSANFKSIKYSCRHEGGTGTSNNTRSLAQKIPVVPDKTYRLSFYYKTITTETAHGCRVWSNWMDAGNIDIVDPLTKPILQSTTNYLKSDDWKQFTVDITSPAGASYFNLEVRTYLNSITYFDDFVFTDNLATYEPEEKLPELTVYPNPASEFLTMSNTQSVQHIDILSLTGSTMWSSDCSGEESITIPLSGLEDGLYIIRIRASGKMVFKKFIKRQ